MSSSLPSLVDPVLYSHGDPHHVWRLLRREGPVSWHEPAGYSGFWAVTSYAAGHEVLQDWQRFTSTNGTFLRRQASEPFPGGGKMLALTDPPQQFSLRKPVHRLFAPRFVNDLENRATKIIQELLRQAREARELDFVTAVAAKIQLSLSADLLGVPKAELSEIAAAIDSAVEATHSDGVEGINAQHAHYELIAYYIRLLGRRRAHPQQDIMSALVTAQQAGAALSDEEIVLTCDNIVVAAGETTRHTISSGLLALLEHPDQWARLQTGDISFSTAAEEILRWTTPVTHLLRTVVADTVVNGVQLRSGDAVTVWIPSLNRDENVFHDSAEFQLDRSPNHHLAFGTGVHFCLGAALARLVVRVLLRELNESTYSIHLSGEPTRLASFYLGGLSALPVEITAG